MMGVCPMGYSNRTFCCPFFRWDERTRVHCEGGKISFPDPEAALIYIAGHCAEVQGWKECSIAQNLMRYYEREDESEGNRKAEKR